LTSWHQSASYSRSTIPTSVDSSTLSSLIAARGLTAYGSYSTTDVQPIRGICKMPIPYRFINTSSCNHPDQNKAERRKAVRSYVARVSAEPFKSKDPKSRNRKRRDVLVFDINVGNLQVGAGWNINPQKRQEKKVSPRVEPKAHEKLDEPHSEPQRLLQQIWPNSILPCSTTDVFRKSWIARIFTNCKHLVETLLAHYTLMPACRRR
jgi:hypothetical protein